MECVFEMISCGIPSLMNIGRRVKAILRFCLRNFSGCGVGITDGRNL
jgi:hypothetical protein